MTGLFRKSPVTAAALILVAFNLIGVPPFAGFFSKVTLITGAIASGRYEFMIALLLASLGNLVIFFRILEHAYFNSDKSKDLSISVNGNRLGALALTTGIFLIMLGLQSYNVMETFIRPVVNV